MCTEKANLTCGYRENDSRLRMGAQGGLGGLGRGSRNTLCPDCGGSFMGTDICHSRSLHS